MAEKVRRLKKSKAAKDKIEPIPISDPSARDEGPRLLPLCPPKEESAVGQKYLDLADKALQPSRKK